MKVIKFPNEPQGEFNKADQAWFNRSWLNWCDNNRVSYKDTPLSEYKEYYSKWREQFKAMLSVVSSRKIGEL